MLRVGLTGGIASGKTAVANVFAELGAGVVDTDQVAREVVAPGQPGLDAVRREFGSGVLLASGELDRRALRAAVFSDPAQRRKLETLLHPLIRSRTVEELEQLSAPYAVVVVPLARGDGVRTTGRPRGPVVDCPPETQLDRLVDRDCIDLDQARSMVNAQAGREARLGRGPTTSSTTAANALPCTGRCVRCTLATCSCQADCQAMFDRYNNLKQNRRMAGVANKSPSIPAPEQFMGVRASADGNEYELF